MWKPFVYSHFLFASKYVKKYPKKLFLCPYFFFNSNFGNDQWFINQPIIKVYPFNCIKLTIRILLDDLQDTMTGGINPFFKSNIRRVWHKKNQCSSTPCSINFSLIRIFKMNSIVVLALISRYFFRMELAYFWELYNVNCLY